MDKDNRISHELEKLDVIIYSLNWMKNDPKVELSVNQKEHLSTGVIMIQKTIRDIQENY